jgi:hypothetical protein
MKIAYFNNHWFVNVGEAFIDIGAMEMLKQAFPEADVAMISNMPQYFIDESLKNIQPKSICERFFSKKTNEKHISTDLAYFFDRDFDADYLVMAGMFATEEFLAAGSRQVMERIVDRGCKLIFIGLGGWDYSAKEVSAFSEFLTDKKLEGFISRDSVAFNAYKNCVNQAYPGIDCAFFMSDAYSPKGFACTPYDVVAFNRTKEPEQIEGVSDNVIRPWHFQSTYDVNIHAQKNTMLSDSPYDYLTVYANAQRVYTDLVHASITSLMYGIPVKYFHDSKRSNVFEAVGAKCNDEGFLVLDRDILAEKKSSMINNLRKIIG